ncbi:MAG: hypothetical protein HYX90_04230 [Chloroflexi bacterium]|nr:hypothetical protein [Chloroflexota bacterium]
MGKKGVTMVELYLHKRKVHSVFELLGDRENDISYSVAWALARCPIFLDLFLRSKGLHIQTKDTVTMRLQHSEESGGITDIEIECPGSFFVIVEAKKGWQLPGRRQLEKYAGRRGFRDSRALVKLILALSECSEEYANKNLEVREIAGVPVSPVSWKEMADLATKARLAAFHMEKRIIDELLIYMQGVMRMQNLDSNRVYVVALAQGKPPEWGISWIDIVEKRHNYFHPVGGGRGGWPTEPPNYVAFRYGGKLQSIHHIEASEVFNNPHEKFPEIPEKKWQQHFLYRLGPAFKPSEEVRTGKIYRSGRVWVALDTLFTCHTISEARDLSNERAQMV